ncbi:MAG TPA: response regulator transcription factor [Nitrospira sp.]|jgi:DNA-binding NarL/FixJ family response regulator|nr:response regulator transcription factor [Nitrospira sp.]
MPRNAKRTLSANSVSKQSYGDALRIFVADSHEIIRAGVRTLLERYDDLTVVGEAHDADSTLRKCRTTKPHVVLLEFGLPGDSPPNMCKRLLHALPSVRVIISMWGKNDTTVHEIIETGAQGYVLKSVSRIELVRAIRIAVKGGRYPSLRRSNGAVDRRRRYPDTNGSHHRLRILSPQERRIIPLIADGNTNKEIAAKLVLSEKTVKNYIANMFAKLEIERRTQAVVLYMKAGRHQAQMGEGPSA